MQPRFQWGRRWFYFVTSSSLYLLPHPSQFWWGHRVSHPYPLCYSRHGTPQRALTISASSRTSAALTGSAPGSLPIFSRPIASCPTCRSHSRIGPCYTRVCKLYLRYLCLRSSALRHPQILGFPGPVAPIPGTACSRPRAPTTLRDFRQGLGSPPAHTPWRGVLRFPSTRDGQIPDCNQILWREMFFWRPPLFSFSLHARGLSILWIISLFSHGRSGGFPRWFCLSPMGCWVGLYRAGLRTRFLVPRLCRRRLAVGLRGSRMYLLLSWMGLRSSSPSKHPAVPPGFHNSAPRWFSGEHCLGSWQSFCLGRIPRLMKSSLRWCSYDVTGRVILNNCWRPYHEMFLRLGNLRSVVLTGGI